MSRHIPSTLAIAFFAFLTCPTIAQETTAESPTAGEQVEQRFKTSDGAEVDYLFYLPESYLAESDNPIPMLLFLHGSGERNGPLSLVAKWGPPKLAAAGEDFPFIIVSPQCPRESIWNSDVQVKRLEELLAKIETEHPIDKSKMYLTGLSMGGYGSWRMAAEFPGKFAAVVPVCGGGKVEFAEKLVDTPIWVFHGDQDGAVPFQKSVEMVDAIKKAGGTSIKFTSLEGIGHNCWSATYATPQVYQWMLQQTAKSAESK